MKTANEYLSEIKEIFWSNDITPSENQLQRFVSFCTLFEEKNNQINLVSRSDIKNLVENHLFQSTLISNYIPPKASKFLDIGTGGGFPGIPFAIFNPLLKGVLVDSISKKINAVADFIKHLKLSNIVAENMRVESKEFIAKYENQFDLFLSRATVPLIVLVRYALPLMKQRGYLMAIKGGELSDEIKQAEIKYKAYIGKLTKVELSYKPNNIRNEKDKKLILLELHK